MIDAGSQFRPEYDFPDRGSIDIAYIIASTPRCGSHYLGHVLRGTGRFGYPLEYFHPGNIRSWATRFGTSTVIDTFHRIIRARTSPNGCFGLKLHLRQYVWTSMHQPIDSLLPRPRVVFLRREDLLAQAISLARARQSSSWISAQPELRPPVYSGVLIERSLREIALANAGWTVALATEGWPVLDITYEAVRSDSTGAMTTIGEFVGIELPDNIDSALPVQLERQADSLNTEWRERYLTSTGGSGARLIEGLIDTTRSTGDRLRATSRRLRLSGRQQMPWK